MKTKSLACWLMVATICPQIFALPQSHAETSQMPVETASRITGIATQVAGDRLNVVLNFASNDRPQISYKRQGDAWVAELNGAELKLENGSQTFAKSNPIPGIRAVEAKQDGNKVQLRVTAPDSGSGSVIQRNTPNGIVVSVPAPKTEPSQVVSQPAQANRQATATPKPLFDARVRVTGGNKPQTTAQTNPQTIAQFVPPTGEATPRNVPDQPVPGQRSIPGITPPVTPQVPGRVPGQVPPFRRLTVPPTGDIAVSAVNLRPELINLGTAERVTRLTLRSAPAIEVLTLIGRVAGLSVVSAEGAAQAGQQAGQQAQPGAPGTGISQSVNLDIENESAQDAFNSILRITGLQASRIGNTIFVATRLPVSLRNVVSRSYRLNQISAGEASAFLVGLGAERVITRQRPIPGVQTAQLGTASQAIVNVQTEAVPVLERVQETPDSLLVLKGLQVVAEERTNSVTLLGTPELVKYAEAQLARIDLRRRQVAVNVRIVEVELRGDQTFGSSLALQIPGATTINSTLGVLGLSFNTNSAVVNPNAVQLAGLINAQIASGNAKVLTDPTLTVQEGEQATVELIEEVLTRVEETTTPGSGGSPPTITRTATFEDSGLVLNVRVARVDDNGFVSLSISPVVAVPLGIEQIGIPNSTSFIQARPISRRTLNSGQIRLRDNQTLILSGVIRDDDRQIQTKVPILGDLPIIGALFRGEQNINRRSEVLIIVTPKIIDDSERSTFGYTYQPGSEVQKVLDSNRILAPEQQTPDVPRLSPTPQR
ncbi:MAG: AMIN domain-containing protein [Oscillatoriales cyanobacterium SM2_2_1]|nr:AMIN domain-containing protein [Oscillatoriales cyanobacterium SM2_2_1]